MWAWVVQHCLGPLLGPFGIIRALALILWNDDTLRVSYKFNELNELRDQAYENSLIYKDKTKKIHDSKIKNRIFNVGDGVLLFNSDLKIFLRKLKTRGSGPFTITKVVPNGTIELCQPDGLNFKVNDHRVKHYFRGDVPELVVPDLQTFPMDKLIRGSSQANVTRLPKTSASWEAPHAYPFVFFSYFRGDVPELAISSNRQILLILIVILFNQSFCTGSDTTYGSQSEWILNTLAKCLQSVEERLVHYKKNEVVFTKKINVLNLEVKLRDKVLAEYRTNLEKAEKERDELKLTLEKLQNLSKSLNTLIDSQVSDKSKAGLGYKELIPESFVNSSELLVKHDNRSNKGYHEVPPPLTGNYIPPKRDLRLIDEHFKSGSVDVYNVSSSVVMTIKTVDANHKGTFSKEEPKPVKKSSFSPPIIEDWVSKTWYKDKAMLAEAQEAGQILDEEQLAFLVDPWVPNGQVVQTIIPNNAAFQTQDLDTYDSDCDDISNAKSVLMANISNYGSDIISKSNEGKVDSSKALDIGSVITKSSRTESDKQDTSSELGNYIMHDVDADIRPVNDQVPFAEEKVFANATLKNKLRKLKGISVDTKFAKASILGKLVLQPLENQSVVRQSAAFRCERPKFSKPRFASHVDVKNDFPKPVTPHYLPKVREFVFVKPHRVITSGLSRNSSKESYGLNDMAHKYYLEDPHAHTFLEHNSIHQSYGSCVVAAATVRILAIIR
uniref:Reverse transcriptase domain-containing protein n=1 Tax=Tanacetum cinerariifolium TaxID=118510 RepID=A0A6L2KZR9_TANCI|nr:reverse transcriptase domain-containing protein [Tanacetum cinerariifolium]